MKYLAIILIMSIHTSQMMAQNDQPFTWVEKMPQFPGGNEALYQFIGTHIHYPDSCRAKGISGNVIVQFVVDTSGYVVNPKIVKGHSCGFNEETLRLISLMNEMNLRWSPGMHNGEKRSVSYMLPIKFALQ